MSELENIRLERERLENNIREMSNNIRELSNNLDILKNLEAEEIAKNDEAPRDFHQEDEMEDGEVSGSDQQSDDGKEELEDENSEFFFLYTFLCLSLS